MKVYFYENECDKWYVAHIVGIRFVYDPFVLSVCFVIRYCSLDKWVFYFFFYFFFNSLNMAAMTPKYFKAIAPNCQYMFDLKFWNP